VFDHDEGSWRFRIRFDPPVPREYLTTEADWADPGKYLLTAMQPHFQARPDQFSSVLLRCLRPNPPNAEPQP